MCIYRESFLSDHCKWQKNAVFRGFINWSKNECTGLPFALYLQNCCLLSSGWQTPFCLHCLFAAPLCTMSSGICIFCILFDIIVDFTFSSKIDGGKYFTVSSASCQLLPQNLQLHFVISQDGNRPIRYQIPIRKIPRFIPKFGAHRSTTVRPAHIFPISEFLRSKTSQTIIFLSDVCFALLIRLIDDHELLHI